MAVLGACSAGMQPATSASAPDRSPSWMSAGAKSAQRLLYISDLGRFDVYVYSFPSLTQVGKLTGFNGPQGECSDAAGDVWIANAGTYQMLEFAHGGTKTIASLSDPVGVPVGCAIDPANGNLAVTNLYGFSGAGSVLVYKNASGTPRVYADPNMYYYYFDGYNRAGDLYVSGATASNAYLLAVLPKGSNSMSPVAIKGGTIYFPGTVAWNSATLVLGDQQCMKSASSCFYELRVSGRTASIERTTRLNGSCDVVEAWVDPTQIAGGDDGEYCGNGRSSVDVWPYPAGGSPSATATGPRAPVGATLSAGGGS